MHLKPQIFWGIGSFVAGINLLIEAHANVIKPLVSSGHWLFLLVYLVEASGVL